MESFDYFRSDRIRDTLAERNREKGPILDPLRIHSKYSPNMN